MTSPNEKPDDDRRKPEIGFQIRFIVEPLDGSDDDLDEETLEFLLPGDEEDDSPNEKPRR